MERLLLYARTVKHLRPRQWVYLPLRRAQAAWPASPRPVEARWCPKRAAPLAEAVAAWGPGDADARVRAAEEVAQGRFEFLGHSETLCAVDWRRRYVSHLWSYNLQYFGYAVDLAWAHRITGDPRFAQVFTSLAEGWIARTDPGRGDGWEPYAVSLRVVNWSYALLLFGDAVDAATGDRLTASLALQLAWLERRLEWHILANHLQKNLQALALGGLLFRGAGAERWRRLGERLWHEFDEQVLADGGHFERSPMYHAIALGDFLESASLRRAVGEPLADAKLQRLRRMVDALDVLSRPDGSLHLFNDTADGVAPAFMYLEALARAVLGVGVRRRVGAIALPRTGYFGWSAAGERLVVDAGEPSPPYQPGHAHCGLLGFELDLAGRRVVVDAGVSGYEGDPLRGYVRSTRAHSTVSIGGGEQSELWGTFRMGRRARVVEAAGEEDSVGYRFSGAYQPFYSPSVLHQRRIERDSAGWLVTDRVEGRPGAPVTSYLHLHPDFRVRADGERWIASDGPLEVLIEPRGVDQVRLRVGERDPDQGWYCPRFGVALPAPVLEMEVYRNDGRPFGYRLRPLNFS